MMSTTAVRVSYEPRFEQAAEKENSSSVVGLFFGSRRRRARRVGSGRVGSGRVCSAHRKPAVSSEIVREYNLRPGQALLPPRRRGTAV